MQPQEISIDVLIEKYAKGGETTIQEVQRRVAKALASVELPDLQGEMEERFFQAMQQGFVPAGRIMSAAGTDIQATLINCFVQPVGDSVSDEQNGKPGIYKALAEAAETMRRGGGVGYDFSRIRPKNAMVKGTSSRASGPLSFMRVFDSSCQTVESAGSRRGAQMGVLRIDHPDIIDFVHAKDDGSFRNFNLSVGVSSDFMRAVEQDCEWELVHDAHPPKDLMEAGSYQRADGKWVYKKVRAREIWEDIMKSTYDHAEPGILFLDTANQENNLWYCETFEATNPCAEEYLPDYGCCCLGSVNLTRFVRNPFSMHGAATFDFAELREVVRTGVRMLDNTLDATYWPLPQQAEEARQKRRIGLGFLGLGDAIIMMGLRYDTQEARDFAAEISRQMRDAAYEASIDLATEKGAFPKFDADKFLSGNFVKRLPMELRSAMREQGMRNSHLLAIAPTGTISLAFADNASNGIEPPFSWGYTRKKRMPDDTTRDYEVADHAWRLYRHLGGDVKSLPPYFVMALKMSAEHHMRMLEAVQPFVDTSISKTVNVPEDYPYEDFKDLYYQAWRAGLKGLATYRPNSILGSVLSTTSEAPKETGTPTDVNPLTQRVDSRPFGMLKAVSSKERYMSPGQDWKSLFLSISFVEVEGCIDGKTVTIERPLEFFMPAAQVEEGQQWIASNMRLLSLVARSGGDLAKALQNMREVVWDKGPVRCGEITKDDGTRAPRFHLSEVAAVAYMLQNMLKHCGYLDAEGGQVPVEVLARRFNGQALDPADASEGDAPEPDSPESAPMLLTPTGKTCPECKGPYLRKVDGCEKCDNCGHIGACG